MDIKKSLGINLSSVFSDERKGKLIEYINLKLSALGCPIYGNTEDYPVINLSQAFIANYREQRRLLSNHLAPVDQRIQDFLDSYFADCKLPTPLRLPSSTLVMDRHGVSRMLSLPANGSSFESDIVKSYRVKQGVIHNPKHDRRTTKGSFHVVEGGLPIPNDKISVPKQVGALLLGHALDMPDQLKVLPFTSEQENKAKVWVSLLLRPVVCPEVEGFTSGKSLEIRFFAPGNLVSNLDFVESIFGNAGDPYLFENDAGQDIDHWTGHTGCVILAPQLIGLTKKELGLPNQSDATDRQKRDGMCWEKEGDLYNEGLAYKMTCRDKDGRIVTVIADNYYGYSKKEVKTQISFSANLLGQAEEEHAGGTVAFSSYDLGEEFSYEEMFPKSPYSFNENVEKHVGLMTLRSEGYAVDIQYDSIYYLPANARFRLQDQTIEWVLDGQSHQMKLLANITYILPSGYRVEMLKPNANRRWRLVGTIGEGFFCHKPCTVSGGGKSEISKPLSDATIMGPVITANFDKDFSKVEALCRKDDYHKRFKNPRKPGRKSRPILSSSRSLGSVIKMLTPSKYEYTPEYNEWLETLTSHEKELLLIVKRLYKEKWGDDLRSRFSVDSIDGTAGSELRFKGQKLITQYLRVGFSRDGSWRTFSLRKDFIPARKLSFEDDISASVVVPHHRLSGAGELSNRESSKFVENCENRFFQRPDDAIIRGYDKQTELDLSIDENFLSNYEPLDKAHSKDQIDDIIRFDKYSQPLQDTIREFSEDDNFDYYVSPAFPRMVDGKPSKNPRYLQKRPDYVDPRSYYIGGAGARLWRKAFDTPTILFPVRGLVPGRRNNQPDVENGVRPLCCFNPIHYMELPELFMEFIASLTGKSPSTVGAGSEGALTKAPFNALLPIHDLNNALVSYLVTGYSCFMTSAGYIGPDCKVDHDVSLLIPEIWCRLLPEEQDPKFLIENEYLEKCEDFEYKGEIIPASRLGYRITSRYSRHVLGRIFTNPNTVFSKEMLRPELQDEAVYVDSIMNIVEAHKRVAQQYFEDGSIELACPPLKALLHIMAHGDFEGKGIDAPEVRELFSKEATIDAEWYQKRLSQKQVQDRKSLENSISYFSQMLDREGYLTQEERAKAKDKLMICESALKESLLEKDTSSLNGSIGVDFSIYE